MKEAMKMALELLAVGTFHSPELQAKRTEVIELGLQALAQQSNEQVKPESIWIAEGHLREVLNGNWLNAYCSPEQDRFADVQLFTHPPVPTAQPKPLTFEQVEDCFPEGPSVFEDAYGDNHTSPRWLHAFARAIEAAHGIKENT